MEFVMQMLEALSITKNGKSTLHERNKSILKGISEEILELNVIPPISTERTYKIIGEKIGVTIKTRLNDSKISYAFKKSEKKYITENYPA